MPTTEARYKYERKPLLTTFQEKSIIKETYGGVHNLVAFDSNLLVSERPSKTMIVMMHPVGGGAYLPMVTGLAAAGHHVLYINGRFRGNDSALVMEKCIIDLGEAVKQVMSRYGYEKFVLGGWSGGGSLSCFYQSQAEHPSITQTPAGDPVDIASHKLPPADGIMLLAAHISRAGTLTEWMDAAVLDESDPYKRDPELDLFDSKNPNQPPYSAAFVEKYRAAQAARNRKITSQVKERLADFKKKGRDHQEFAFVTHCTFADPKFFDPAIDPNDRDMATIYPGDPMAENNGPAGLGRYSTLRSWLSQWSLDDSNADGVKCAAKISKPALVICNTGDVLCTPSHTHRLYDAFQHDNKELYEVKGANHYYFGQPEKVTEAIGKITEWMGKHGFMD